MADEKSVLEQLEDVVRPVFRPNAVIQSNDMNGGIVLAASWRLGTHRMDNWSREIHLIIPPQAADRYAKLNEKGKAKANANLVSYVRLKLEGFRPEHDRPRFLLPPIEVWAVKYEDLFPK
jgi:hypothetical protein